MAFIPPGIAAFACDLHRTGMDLKGGEAELR
jgi:hypothetical protein